jgi:hypothetical protein
LSIEQKKIEKAFNREREMSEESKTEEDTARDQTSRTGDSEKSSSSEESDEQTNDDASLLMAAPNTGGEHGDSHPDFRDSVLSASALNLDDTEQDTDRKIDE